MPNGFVHVELNTTDLPEARSFYSKLFAWKVTPMPDMPEYVGVYAGRGAVCGGMQVKPMAGAPTAWLPYVEVADVKKTIAKAKKLGAEIVLPYQAIGDMGAIGVFVDPTGAALGVWAKAKPKVKKRQPRR
jgi:predicted enzyme related to lactoylglutathione lyase